MKAIITSDYNPVDYYIEDENVENWYDFLVQVADFYMSRFDDTSRKTFADVTFAYEKTRYAIIMGESARALYWAMTEHVDVSNDSWDCYMSKDYHVVVCRYLEDVDSYIAFVG